MIKNAVDTLRIALDRAGAWLTYAHNVKDEPMSKDDVHALRDELVKQERMLREILDSIESEK
jgi:hypothetical protein